MHDIYSDSLVMVASAIIVSIRG